MNNKTGTYKGRDKEYRGSGTGDLKGPSFSSTSIVGDLEGELKVGGGGSAVRVGEMNERKESDSGEKTVDR